MYPFFEKTFRSSVIERKNRPFQAASRRRAHAGAQSARGSTTHSMADNTPKTEEATPKPVEEKKPEEVKPAETKEAAKPAVTEEKKAAAAEDLPDVSHSEEFKTMEEDETMLLNVYVC